MCGARNLGEALHRIAEGAAMIRTTGESGTGEGCFLMVGLGVYVIRLDQQQENACMLQDYTV